MTKLVVPGRIDPEPSPSVLAERLPHLSVRTERSIEVGLARDGAAEESIEADPEQVLEITFADGGVLWTRVDDLERDLELARSGVHRGSVASDTLSIPPVLPLGRPSRGVGTWVIRGLKFLGIDIAGSIADFVSGHVEGRLEPGPGLYRCTAASATALEEVGALDPQRPILVFLHGTASSTEGSFGDLWRGGEHGIGRLLERYGDQVLTFQHRTLTESPIANALELLGELDKRRTSGGSDRPLRLHLVSHSRGGLVGELLCRGGVVDRAPFDEDDAALFSAAGYERERRALSELGTRLQSLPFQVERFVRVACPARGTTLADGRLDRYLSGIVNVMQSIPGFLGGPVFEGFSALTLGVVKKRSRPEELPGLEAMMPVSPTIRLLNRPGVRVAGELHVLGGDIESGRGSRLKTFLSDLYYRADHDLVVDTRAMLGGTEREAPVRYWLDTGARVDHFRYFGNSATASRLWSALIGESDGSFRTLSVEPYRVDEGDYRKRAHEPRPIVFVLPGIMGSHLKVGDSRVWLHLLSLARGSMSKLAIDAAGVLADGPLDDAYGELLVALASSHDVRPFAYDWRRPLAETATAFEAALGKALDEAERGEQPVRIVAHSMGGLVVRTLQGSASGRVLWERLMHHPDARFVMLGTPNGGSHAIAALLLGRDALMHKLALLDLRNRHDDLLKTIAGFDGVLQLLPHSRASSLDLYDPAVWARLRELDLTHVRGLFGGDVASDRSAGIPWSVPDPQRLLNAAAWREQLGDDLPDPDRTLYVAGVAAATAVDVVLDERARPGRQVRVLATALGDGRVPWASGIPDSLPPGNVYYLGAAHGDLASTRSAFPALLELLEKGHTARLERSPPRRRDIVAEPFDLPPEMPDRFPDHADLAAAALGGTRREPAPTRSRTKVRLVHGDLAHSNHPVLVGHYEDDSLLGTEDYLDRQLQGRLRERHARGLYPGPVGTSLTLLNSRGQRLRKAYPGALVVGLGSFGDLTPGALTATVVKGVMEYALGVLDDEREAVGADELPGVVGAPLTTLLIGGCSELTIADSLHSILRAVRLANERLRGPRHDKAPAAIAAREAPARDPRPSTIVQIDRLDFVECWEDRAVLAMRALRRLADAGEIEAHFDVTRHLEEGPGGRRRVAGEDQADWWQRMRIREGKDGGLHFETFAQRARVDTQLQSTQKLLVDRLLARAGASGWHDPMLGRTLFELLVPNELKQYARDRRRLLLVVDAATAAYPWELMQGGTDSKPLSVEAGVVRQLTRDKDRVRPQPILAQQRSALVVGDPVGSEGSSGFLPLRGAREEAQLVAGRLSGAGYDPVIELVGEQATPLQVISELYARPYGILHIAAHGVFEQALDASGRPLSPSAARKDGKEETAPRVTGVVLGDGIYLTPIEIAKMRLVPQLVFINCCHLGKIDERVESPRVETPGGEAASVEYHRLAASVATELIGMGVRAVLVAGWAVDDAAAKLFARTFYDEFLRGVTFGQAVLSARRKVYYDSRGAGQNTWGAYQCYGDPDLTMGAPDGESNGPESFEPHAAAELREHVASMASETGYSDKDARERACTELESLGKPPVDSWLDSAATCGAFAEAWAKLGDFGKATYFHDRARECELADGTVASLEQLANLRARLAVERFRSPEKRSRSEQPTEADALAAAVAEITAAKSVIDALLRIGVTQERLSILGGLHKRRAVIESDPDALAKHLDAMARAYGRSHDTALARKSANRFYPLQNKVAARIARRWAPKPSGGIDKQIASDLDALERLLSPSSDTVIDFWILCQEPDTRLLQALAHDEISPLAEADIVAAYREARRRGGSDNELMSVVEHLGFFVSVLERLVYGDKKKEALLVALRRMRDVLDADRGALRVSDGTWGDDETAQP